MPISNWSTSADDNTLNPPFGWPEGMAPSAVNNTARQMMADIRQAQVDGDLVYYPQTSAETTEAVTPTNYERVSDSPVIDIRRVGGTGDDSTDNAAALVNAVKSFSRVFFPDGTYVISNAVLTKTAEILLADGATLKHQDSATDHMIETAQPLRINGGTLDGNKANQTGRYNLVAATGTDLIVQNCHLTNSVNAAVNTDGVTERVLVQGNKFTSMAEHGGTAGEVSYCVYIQGATAVVDVSNNVVLGDVPSTNNVAPTGFFMSGTSISLRCCDNYFDNIGQNQAGNQGGCIDLYTDADETIVCNNVFIGSYYQPIKLQNANNLTCVGNVIQGFDGDGPIGMINWAYARAFGEALSNCVIANNVINISGDTTNYGITLIGDATFNIARVCLSGNVIEGGLEGIRHSLVNSISISGGVISGQSSYGVHGEAMGDAGPSVNISGVAFDNIGDVHVHYIASELTDNANVSITGCQFDGTSGTPTHFILCRGDAAGLMERVSIVGNQMRGTGSTDLIDLQYIDEAIVVANVGTATTSGVAASNVTLLHEQDNSWNVVTETATGTFTASLHTLITDIDSSGGAVAVTVPDGLYEGQKKVISMSDATTSSTVSVTSHETSSPEVFTFAQTTDYLVLEWSVSQAFWWTVKNIGAAV